MFRFAAPVIAFVALATSGLSAQAAPISPVSATVLAGDTSRFSSSFNSPDFVIDGTVDFNEFLAFSGFGVVRFDLGGTFDVSGVNFWNNGGNIAGDGEGVAVFVLRFLTPALNGINNAVFSPTDTLPRQDFAASADGVAFVDMEIFGSHGRDYSIFHEIMFDAQAVTTPVPAPGALALLGLGLLGLGGRRRAV